MTDKNKQYAFTPSKILQAFDTRDYQAVTDEIAQFIWFFKDAAIDDPTDDEKAVFQTAAEIFFEILARPEYIIPEPYVVLFVTSAPLFSNLARITNISNTDIYLSRLAGQPHNLPKILTLYTPRNNIDIPLKTLFKANPALTTCWYAMLSDRFRGITKSDYHKYRAWMLSDDAWEYYTITGGNYSFHDWLTHPAFEISYLSPQHEKPIRQAINKQLDVIKLNRTKPLSKNYKNILVISYTFLKGKTVYRAIAEYFKALKGDYKVTLFLILSSKDAEYKDVVDWDIFDNVIKAQGENGFITKEAIATLTEGDYGVIIYPDTSLCFNSSILAMGRFAPIQITTYGHPVSSWSNEIDYFIGGQDTETPHTYQNYSERLVLLPGNGNCPLPVDCVPENEPEADEYLICCSWGYLKMNWEWINVLKQLRDKSEKEIKFYFTDVTVPGFNYLAAKKDLADVLGESAILSRNMPRPDYMKGIAQCRFAIDSWPFGGFNRVLDVLAIGKPIVIREGDRAYNRMNAALLRRMGLQELIVQKPEELIRKSLEIINNEDYRQALIDIIKGSDIYNKDEAIYFKKALDFLIENDAALKTFQNKKPIMIKR